MYPRNNASPLPILIGTITQISDGVVQTAGVSVSISQDNGAYVAGANTPTVEQGEWSYTPSQAETDCSSLRIVLYKTGCYSRSIQVVFTASGSFGYAGTDQSKIANPTATVALTNTSIKSVADEVTANVTKIAGQAASAAAPVTFPASVANETTASSILTAIQNLNNLSAKMNIFASPLMEIPDAGSTVYAFTVVVRDDEDKLVSLDASPTITAANAAGTSRSGNLSAVANPSTGRYTFTYSVASTHPAESLRIAVSGAVSTEARYIEWIGAVVDYDTLTVLNAIKLKTDNLPANPAAVSDIPTAAQVADAVLEESVDDHDHVAQSLAKYISVIKKANTIVEGTVTSAVTPTTTSFSTNVNYPTGAFKHAVLVFTNSAAINEQNSPILGYVNTNGAFTIEEPLTVAPTVGDEFIIVPTNHVHSIAAIVAGVLGQETSTSAYDSGDVGYVLRQLFALIESDGAGGWRYKASAINLGANAPAGWINVGAFASNAIGGDAIAASAVTKVTAGLFKYGDVQRWNSPANQIDVTITKV